MSELPADLPDVQMVQCDVTGRTVPLDETIELHGYRVCAEGKQILLDRLKAGEALPGELERPTVLRRFVAMFVDWLMLVALAKVLNWLASIPVTDAESLNRIMPRVAVMGLLKAMIVFCYFGMMHTTYGQTVGKMAAKLKVVQPDGSAITAKQAWIRCLLHKGPNLLVATAMMFAFAVSEATLPLVGIFGTAGILVLVYILASIITALVDRQQQRAIHDYAAGTRVIRIL